MASAPRVRGADRGTDWSRLEATETAMTASATGAPPPAQPDQGSDRPPEAGAQVRILPGAPSAGQRLSIVDLDYAPTVSASRSRCASPTCSQPGAATRRTARPASGTALRGPEGIHCVPAAERLPSRRTLHRPGARQVSKSGALSSGAAGGPAVNRHEGYAALDRPRRVAKEDAE
jgi:hypothetical protein